MFQNQCGCCQVYISPVVPGHPKFEGPWPNVQRATGQARSVSRCLLVSSPRWIISRQALTFPCSGCSNVSEGFLAEANGCHMFQICFRYDIIWLYDQMFRTDETTVKQTRIPTATALWRGPLNQASGCVAMHLTLKLSLKLSSKWGVRKCEWPNSPANAGLQPERRTCVDVNVCVKWSRPSRCTT